MIPLKKPDLRRYFNFPAHAAYAKYASFLENFAPCILGFLSGIRFDGLVKSPRLVMPDLIRHPEHIENTGFRPTPE